MASTHDAGRQRVERGRVDPVLVTLGLVVALAAPLTLRPSQFLALFVLGAFLGAFAVMLARSVSGVPDVTSREGLLGALHMGAVGAVLAVMLGVLTEGLGALGWAVGLVSLPAYAFLRRLHGRFRNPAQGPGPGRQAPGQPTFAAGTGPFARCSTSELTAAWTASHELLEASSSTLMTARIVALRQEYVDELERRDPVALQRWLACGAPASIGPGRFLTRRDDGSTRPEIR
jgi:hypothetical protein